MNQIISISWICTGFLFIAPFAANGLNSTELSLNLEREKNVLPAQVHPPYAIGYTVHYRRIRDKKWTVETFQLELRDAERVARRLQRLGFSTQIRSRAAAERPSLSR